MQTYAIRGPFIERAVAVLQCMKATVHVANLPSYCNLPYSALASLRMGMSGSFNPANENHVIAVGKAIHHQALAVA